MTKFEVSERTGMGLIFGRNHQIQAEVVPVCMFIWKNTKQ